MNKTHLIAKPLIVIAVAALLFTGAMASPKKKAVAHKKAAHAKKATKVAKKPAKKVAVKTANPALKPLVGTWYLTDGMKPVKSTKIAFKPEGTFLFSGSTWKSEGTYALKDGAVTLNWTKVDGAPVKVGTMHKTLPLTEDMSAFTIDKFTYSKSF